MISEIEAVRITTAKNYLTLFLEKERWHCVQNNHIHLVINGNNNYMMQLFKT